MLNLWCTVYDALICASQILNAWQDDAQKWAAYHQR